MPKYKPLYSLYKGLRESNYDVPDSYVSFQKTLTQPGNAGAKSRRGLYQSLKDSNYDVSDTYEDFYKNLFVPVNSTTSRALKIGENPNTPTVNRYRQKMFDSVDPNKNGLNNLSNRAVGQAVRATNNVRKPVVAKVVNQKGKPTGKEFAITPAKTAEDLDREYAQETTKNWENELHDQMADADKDAAKISDMFKSFIGSTDEVGSVWGNMTRGGGIAGTPHSVTTNNGILENTEARQLLAAGDYNRKRRELLQLEKNSRNGAIFDNHSFFRGMYDAAKDTGLLTGGASDLINAGSLLATKQDLDNGVHTEAGDMLMQQAVKNSDAQSQYGDNQGWMYTGGVITTNMAPFMVQIGSAGFSKGMSNAIGKVVQGAASKVALGTMEKATGMAGAHIANYIGKVTGLTTKAFGKAIQYGIVGAAQANTVGLGNVANDVINRYTGQVYQDEQGNYKFGTFDSDGNLVHEGGEDFLTAFVKGDAAQTIEFATELAGGGIDAAGTALKNFVTKGGKKIINKYNMENVSKVIDFLLNNKVSKNARYLKAGADRTLGKVELNSIVGESLEEELGIIANTVFTGDNKISDLWDEKQQSQIWGGMLLSIGLMKGAVAPFHAYNAKQYYSYKHKIDKADVNLSQLLGKEKWEELRNQIDATTNEDMPEMVNRINRDVALGKNRQPVREYIQNLLIMRGYDIGNMLAAKKAVEDKGEGVSVKNMEKNQAYQQGRDAYGYDTHEIQLDQEDKQKSLAQLIGISEQQLASMSDEELEALSGRDDNIDRLIYDYQLSTARYEGVIDNARDQIDLEVQRAAQAVDMYTDKSRNTIRNATIKATGGLEDYGVYIINGNIATHEDGSIDISNSDDMILYYDPTTNTVEHADATMFAELGSEENADEVRSQAMADAKEKAIKETTGIIDGVVEVGTQFKTVGADGTEHTYEVLADNGDGTAMITIDGNIPTELVNGESVNIPVSFADLQQMKDLEDQKRLEAAKSEREQMEKERAAQQTQETEQSQPSFDFNQILNDNGNVVLVDVLDKDGNTKYPDSRLFLIRDAGAKAKVVELKSDGTIVPHAVNKEDVATISSMSLDEYKQAMPESSMIEDNSGEESDEDSQLENLGLPKGSEIWMSGDGFGRPKERTLSRVVGIDEQGSIVLEDKDGKKWSASFDYINNHRELPPLDENTNIVNEENNQSESNAEENTPAPEQTPAITLEDGTIVPMLEDGNPDFSKLTAAQTAELYDTQFGEDADSIVSGYVSDAKKALDKASNMTVKGKTFVEQKAAKDAKEKAIADAQAAYDSAIAIRDAYNERQLAKVEDTAEGRKELIEKARRKFARLKSAVKDDAEAVSQLYRDTIGSLLHRLYDGTGIDVTDTTPLTAEEYVASNLGAHSLNYEGTETSKGVKQETGLSREDFAKTQLLAADGKGTTIDALVHSLWENRPSNLESLDTQDIRNALIGVLNSGFKASEARNFVENIRIAQAENILEEQKRAQENAAYAEQHKAEPEAELKAKSDEKAELKAKSEEKSDNESSNESNDLGNDLDNEKTNDKINDNINAPEVPEDATDENPLGLQLSEDKVPFEIEGGKSGETYDINDNEDRQRLINDNKVDDKDILDIDMPKHVHKAIKELCKKMGLKVQFLYMGARSNGWIENGTMYLALDTEKATQFVFGHEMTHAIKQKNPEAYKELVKVAMAVTTRKKFEEDLAKVYQNYHGISGYNNVDDYVEEVVADNLGKFINDFDLAQKFSLRLNHPVLATILHAIQKIKSLLYGDFYKSVDALERIVEKAYVDTAKGEVTNSETGENVSFSLRQKPEPKKKGVGYKVFVLKDGKLYPPMVANPDGAATPVGVWLDADAAPIAGESKTGRPQVKQGGKGTQGGSGKLAYRPGWHLGVVPYAIQFNRKDAEGNKTLFPKNFVFAEVEYAADVDYQEEARQEGINPSGKYQHSLAGLKHLPTDGYYMYRTNPNPETDPWVITGAMKVNRILTRAEQAELVKNAGREPQQIQEGDIVTDDVVNSINQEIADAPKFSLKSKPVRFEAGKKLSDEEKKEVLSTLKDAYKVNGVPYHIEETAGGKEKRVYEPTADSYVVSDITNRPLRYYITLPDGRVAHPTEVYPNISDNEAKSSATKQGLLDEEVDQIVSAAIGNMKDIADNAKAIEVLTELQNLPHETHDVGYGMNNAQSYNYKTGIFTSDAAQAIDYVVRRMRRKEDVPTEIPAALKKAVADSYGMVDNLIGGMSTTKFSLKKVNDDFNQRLEELVKNPNQKDKILRLGRSSSFLKVGGITDAEIELDFDKFIRKSGDKYKNNHPFAASDLINLPMALAEPIAVFNSTTANDHVVLTELQKDGKNFIVAVRAVEQHRKGGVVLEVNKITSLYPKEERGIVYWINNGRISNVDKEKALHFIEALQPHAGTTITDEELKSAANIINSFETTKGNGEKVDVEEPKTFEEFLNHPSLKFSIKNEEQRKAAEDAYEYASKLRPNKYAQYALVDMSNPSNSPQYYEKRVLADRWRRFYNKAVHNELDDVYKDAWGNYKLFDLDRPFADQVNEVKGDVPNEFNAPDVVANKNADNESGAEYHEYKQDEPSSITYKDRYKAFKQREANREKTAGLRKERKETEDSYNSKSKERIEYNKQLMKEYMDEHGLSSENDIPYDVWDNLRSKSFEKYQDELDSLFNKYKDLDKQIKAVAEPRFSLKDEKIKSVAEKFGINEDDVAMYANAVEKGSTAEAARARANIKRYLLQANEDKISSFKELMKYTVPVNEALKENFGDLDAMIEERRKQVEAERNAMEAARKRAQEEEEKRQKHLDELSLIPTDELDKRYMDAIANNDESTAREMLDESARRKGYGDVDSDYQGQGAWAAPSNPQYESDEARRADIENSPDVNLEDIALGYSLQPDDYFDNPRAYMNNTAYGLESAHVIKNALDAIKNGEKDVKVKVYRAVPTSVKEGKLRNGDWVTPSKKYAEMHGDNRLEGKYRIIEDEVPANQLWWDGNDANEFGFDDGKEYRYKNAKNNRKLNDLITYDNKGNVIPPSKRFNSRKNDIRFSLAGERGAAADKAEERIFRMDNLSVARKMEEEKKDAKAIKMATGWERGADGKWRYEIPDAKIKDTMDVGGGQIVKRYEDDMLWNGGKLSDVIDAPELFKAYPQLKGVRIDTDAIMNDMPSHGEYDSKTNTITIHADELKYMNDILNHEIQHAIQGIEGFAAGGSPTTIRGEVKKRFNEVTKQIKQLRAEGKEDEAKALIEKNRGLYNAYMKNDDFNSYKSLAGEVEARNVSARLNMTPEERRKTLAESTEDVARKDQILLGVGDVSFSLRDMADGKESGAADMAEDLKSLNTPDEVDDAIKTAINDMPSGWKMANKKMIHIAQALGENRKAEIAGEEPKFSLKDGTLIKAGTYFSGGGLVEEGLKGIIDPVVAVEYDEKISGVYRNNFGQHIVTADVRDVDPKELVKHIDGEVEYFHASPVCKNYSQAKSNHAEVELDKETAASTAEFINAIKPKVVTIENVKGYKDSEAMKTITDALDANGYTWDADVYNAADYGGYTNRERLIVRAVREGKLPEKPKKMAHKSGWYEAVADIIPTLTEKKNGVAPWMDIRLKADGIDWRHIDKPLYVMGSAYADGKVPHAFADELLPTLRTKSGDVIVMPDGKVYRAMGRVLARVSGVSDDYKMPFSENLSHTIIGNGIPTQLTEHVIAPLLQNTLRPTTPEDGNTKFSLRYDQFEHDLNQWKKDNNLPKDAQRPTIPQRNAGESAVDFLRRVDEYRKQMALWKTAPTYEQHLLSNDTALGEFNRELQRGSVLKRIAFQDSMLAIRKAQEAIMKEVGVDRLNMAEDAYTAENRSHGKGKNEFEEYNNEFLQPLRKAYHQMKKVLGDSYDNVRIYMVAKHGLERNAQMAFKKSLESDFDDVAKRSAAYRAYKGDMNRIINDSDLEFGRIDFKTWRNRDNLLRTKYSPSYMAYRYDENGIVFDYSGLSALFGGPDFEEAGHKLVRDIEDKYVTETHDLWDATNAATKKILRDGYKAGMMSKDTYQYVRDMYGHYIPLRGWDGTTADQVWDYIGGGKGSFNQTLKTAHGRTSIADDPIAYIENMAESGILLNNKNWVKQHLMLLAQNHPTSLLTLSKAWYVKSVDANGNEEWIPATPQITSQMDSNQVKAAIDAFEKKMEQMAQTGDATQKRDGLNIAYPQTHSEEREHEVRVMKDGEEYVIYVNGDPQLAQAMNNTRAHRVREIQSGKLDRAAAWLGRKMAAAYTSLSPLFIPSNYFRDLTMTLASTAIREDAKYNYLLRKNLATSWNLGFMLRDYQNGKLRDKVNNGNATPKEQMFYDFMMNGGETGFVSSLDVEDLKKKFKNDLKDLDRWKTNPVKVGHTIMDGIEFLNRAIEDSNRFAVYMTSIQYGRSIDEAVNDAKDVTLNFNRKGTGEYGWQMIRNLYLFINPAVQSLQTLGALVKHHPFKFTAVTASWLASGVLVPIVNAALMSLLGGDDDKDKYWQFTKWDRRNNLIMWVPFTHEYIKIPLAQEFRAFYGVGDMIASKMMGGELAEESWSQYAEDLLGQVVDMLPLDPTGYDGNIAVSLMPNAIRPVFELAFNVDFTGKPLFKETEYNKYDPNFTKAYVGTPDWLVRASRMVNSIGNDYPDVQQNSIDAFGDPRYNLNNPAVVDHVLSSYLGGAYTMGSQVLGVLTKSLNDPKEIKVADIPLFSKFVSNPDDRPVTKKQGDEFWNMKENHDRAANTLSKLKKQAKVDGDYSMLERFYGSEEYKQYKQDDAKVKKYEEDKKKERAEESGEEYRPHKLNAEDIYKAHATPKDDFEDLKLKQLYTKLNGFKTSYDLLVDTAPSQSDGYYNTNKAAIDAIDEISLDKQEISELKKGFLDDGKDTYNAEDMKQIRDLRKKILAVLEKANKVVVANQKAKTEK